MRSNTAGQYLTFQLISATDGSAVTSGSPAVVVDKDGAGQVPGDGTPVHAGGGAWRYPPSAAETNATHLAATISLAGAISQTVNVYPVAKDASGRADVGAIEGTDATDYFAAAIPLHLARPTADGTGWEVVAFAAPTAGQAAALLDGDGAAITSVSDARTVGAPA